MMRKMPRFLVALRRAGQVYHYWQPSGPLRAAGFAARRLSNVFEQACREAATLNAELDRWRAGDLPDGPRRPGTLPALIEAYRQDESYIKLRPKTQVLYDKCLARIEQWSATHGHPRIKAIDRKSIKAWHRAMRATAPIYAAATIKILRIVLGFAMDEGEIAVNPAARMKLRTGKPRDQIWPAEMIARIIAAAQAAGRPSIALAVVIAANTALREGDVLSLVWAAFDGQTIKVRQHKTGAMVVIPATAELRAALEAAPRLSPLILINEYTNRPWAEEAFRANFRRIATRAKLPATLRFMDLRRTGATALAEAGATIEEVAAITGHSIDRTAHILETYIVRTEGLAKNAIIKLEQFRRDAGLKT